ATSSHAPLLLALHKHMSAGRDRVYDPLCRLDQRLHVCGVQTVSLSPLLASCAIGEGCIGAPSAPGHDYTQCMQAELHGSVTKVMERAEHFAVECVSEIAADSALKGAPMSAWQHCYLAQRVAQDAFVHLSLSLLPCIRLAFSTLPSSLSAMHAHMQSLSGCVYTEGGVSNSIVQGLLLKANGELLDNTDTRMVQPLSLGDRGRERPDVAPVLRGMRVAGIRDKRTQVVPRAVDPYTRSLVLLFARSVSLCMVDPDMDSLPLSLIDTEALARGPTDTVDSGFFLPSIQMPLLHHVMQTGEGGAPSTPPCDVMSAGEAALILPLILMQACHAATLLPPPSKGGKQGGKGGKKGKGKKQTKGGKGGKGKAVPEAAKALVGVCQWLKGQAETETPEPGLVHPETLDAKGLEKNRQNIQQMRRRFMGVVAKNANALRVAIIHAYQ
ncbi:hypothetical protein KIPB_007533, partial [Kipferlia bialata]